MTTRIHHPILAISGRLETKHQGFCIYLFWNETILARSISNKPALLLQKISNGFYRNRHGG